MNPNTIKRFKETNACVLLPVYNNEAAIGQVIEDVLKYTRQIVVVNDGSSDGTLDVIKQYEAVQLVSYSKNKGKGYALRQGFKYAYSQGYTHALSMDTDGQHLAKDLNAFIEAMENDPKAIIIGSRTFDSDNVPGGSSFGRKFSNFWFRAETGIKHSDTQSGFRLYPLKEMQKFRWITKRYEFEIEVIVRYAWRGGTVTEIPVSVYYPKAEERVSHFRPYKDFIRISLLNSVLVLLAFFYGLPRRTYHIIRRNTFKEIWNKYIAGSKDSNMQLSQAMGLGVFMGIVPFWGWQTVLAISSAHFLKLNKALTVLAANISIPPMMPFIIFGSFYAGSLVLNRPIALSFQQGVSLESIQNDLIQYAVGSMVLATAAGLFVFGISFMLFKIFRNNKA